MSTLDTLDSGPQRSKPRPLVALLLSLLAPGAGHLYAGRLTKGLALWAVGLGLVWLALLGGFLSTFAVLALFLAGALVYYPTSDAHRLTEALLNFRTVMNPAANELPGTFRVGTRDQLVTAIGLATQVDQPTATSVWDLAGAWGPVEDLLQ